MSHVIQVREKYNADLAVALATEPEGTTFHLSYLDPQHPWEALEPPARYVAHGRNMTIRGEGMGTEDLGLRYWRNAAYEPSSARDSTILRIGADANGFTAHNLVLSNNGQASPGSGDGICFEEPALIGGLTLRNLMILSAGRNALRLRALNGPGKQDNRIVGSRLDNVRAFGCRGEEGILLEWATYQTWTHVGSTRHGTDEPPNYTGRGFTFRRVSSSSFTGLLAESVAGGVLMEDCGGCTIDTPHMEDFAHGGVNAAITLRRCNGCRIEGGEYGGWSRPGLVSIRLEDCRGCFVGVATHAGVGLAVDIDTASRDCTVMERQADHTGARVAIRVPTRRGHRII